MTLIPWRNKRAESTELAPWDRPLAQFREMFDNLFDRFLRDGWEAPLATSTGEWTFRPRLDMSESDTQITVRAELPGVRPQDVDIEVSGNLLTLRGEKCEQKEEKGRDYRYRERHFGSFRRTVQLPATVDRDKVTAEYKDGVLTVTLAKDPKCAARRIKVRNA